LAIQMSLRDILFCVILPFSPAVNCRAIIGNPYGICPRVGKDVKDYAAPKVHHSVLECPPSEPESVSRELGPCCLDTPSLPAGALGNRVAAAGEKSKTGEPDYTIFHVPSGTM